MSKFLKTKVLFIVAFLALSFPATLLANQILTFEEFPDGTILTNQYAGVTFSNATVYTYSDSASMFPPHSGTNIVHNPQDTAMELLFTSPVDYFSGYFSFYNDFNMNPTMKIEAFNLSNTLLDTVYGANTLPSLDGSINEYLKIEADNISKVILTHHLFSLDDIEFAPVPEPATFILFGSGLAGLAFYRRKRK